VEWLEGSQNEIRSEWAGPAWLVSCKYLTVEILTLQMLGLRGLREFASERYTILRLIFSYILVHSLVLRNPSQSRAPSILLRAGAGV
jgi:hypothetical protein